MLKIATWGLAAALLLGIGSSSARDDAGKTPKDGGDTIDELIQQLGSDDAQTRQDATASLVFLGEVAVPALKKALADSAPGPARTQLELIFKMFEERPLKLVEKALEAETCSICKERAHWKIIPIEHAAPAKYMPGCKSFILDWVGCQDKPVRSRIVGGTKYNELFINVKGAGDLKPYLAPVHGPDEALEEAGILFSFVSSVKYGIFWDDKLPAPILKEGTVHEAADKSLSVARSTKEDTWTVRYNAEGRFQDLTIQPLTK